MKFSLVILTLTILYTSVSARIDPKHLKCLVCRTIFEELHKAIQNIDKWKKVDVGNFRMDSSGNLMQQKLPAHRSSVYISEMIDTICKKMDDYVRVYYKATGKLALMRLMMPSGFMNPEFSKAKFVTDDDLNQSLEYNCERMFEENEDEITALYKNRPEDEVMPDAETEICFKHTGYCEDWMLPTEEDTDWTVEKEKEYVKIHGRDHYGFDPSIGGAIVAPDDEEEAKETPTEEQGEEIPAEEQGEDIPAEGEGEEIPAKGQGEEITTEKPEEERPGTDQDNENKDEL